MATAYLTRHAAPEARIEPISRGPARFYHSIAFWTVLVVAIGVAWRTVRYVLRFPIWGDESFVCVNFLDTSFTGLLGPLQAGQICPLPFLWSELALYQWLGPSELVMRLLPYLAGLCALPLFWMLCRRVLPVQAACLAMALLAVSYYPVRHAVEVKPYAGDLLVALSLTLPAAFYLLNPAHSGWLALLALVIPAAVVASYPAALTAGAIGLALAPVVWRQGRRELWFWFLLFNMLLGASFLANYLLIGKPQLSPHVGDPNNAFNSTWHDWFPDFDPASLLWWFLKAHTGNMLAYPIGGPDFASSLTTLLCLVGAWSWWRQGNRHILALLGWSFAVSMAAAIVHKYPYGGSARLDQHLAPAICLLAGNGIAAVLRMFAKDKETGRLGDWEKKPITPSPCLLVSLSPFLFLALFGAAGIVRDIARPYKTTAELWNRDFTRELIARSDPGDRIVFFHGHGEVRPGLEWYLRQHDDRIVWDGAIDWDQFDGSSGKIWCVRVDRNYPRPDMILNAVARGGRAPIMIDRFQSVAPPEHGDDPEIADVYCFAPRPQ